MNDKEFAQTGLKRVLIVWTLIISSILICVFSDYLNISDSKYETFAFLALSVIIAILGLKGSDNRNISKIEIKKMELKKDGD